MWPPFPVTLSLSNGLCRFPPGSFSPHSPATRRSRFAPFVVQVEWRSRQECRSRILIRVIRVIRGHLCNSRLKPLFDFPVRRTQAGRLRHYAPNLSRRLALACMKRMRYFDSKTPSEP